MNASNFITDVLSGESLLDDVDAYVSFWHENNLHQSMQEFLGLTDYEYDQWLIKGNTVLRDILYCRRHGLEYSRFEKPAEDADNSYKLDVLNKYIAV